MSMARTIAYLKHLLLSYCHTEAIMREFVVLMRDNYKRTPASRATYVVSLDRALVKRYEADAA